VKILALDTATENCSAALLINGNLRTREMLLNRGHAEHILTMVSELLADAEVALQGLDAIAFGRGPGAFTGVRLAASVTQGLAFGAAVRVVPVSNLQALAQRVLLQEPAAARVLVCTDARMHEVYCGAFERSAGGLATAAEAERVVAPEAVKLPAPWVAAQSVGVGSAFAAYPELQAALPGLAVRAGLWPRASEMVQLAAAAVRAGHTLAPEEALPVYLRDDVARPPASGASKSLI
jgi:tRNA threonylcarbamoyladenosine biosynthesis protein TsaB